LPEVVKVVTTRKGRPEGLSLYDSILQGEKDLSEREDLPPEAYRLHKDWAKEFPNERLHRLSMDSLMKLCELMAVPNTIRSPRYVLVRGIDEMRASSASTSRTSTGQEPQASIDMGPLILPDRDELRKMHFPDLLQMAEDLGVATRVPAPQEVLLDRVKCMRNYLMREADKYTDRFTNNEDLLLYQKGHAFLKQLARDLGALPNGTAYNLAKKLRGPLAVLTEPEKMLMNFFELREIQTLCTIMGIETDTSRITLIRRLEAVRLAQRLILQRITQEQQPTTTTTQLESSSPSSGSLDYFSWNDDPVEWMRQATDTFSHEKLRSLCAQWSDRYSHRKKYSNFELVQLLCRGLNIRMPTNPVQRRRKLLDQELQQLKLRLGDAYVAPVPYSGTDPLGTLTYGGLRQGITTERQRQLTTILNLHDKNADVRGPSLDDDKADENSQDESDKEEGSSDSEDESDDDEEWLSDDSEDEGDYFSSDSDGDDDDEEGEDQSHSSDSENERVSEKKHNGRNE